MSRVVNLKLSEGEVATRCSSVDVGVSAMESLPDGGTRLVCMSGDGAELIRQKLKRFLIKGDVERTHYRPATGR